MQPTLMILSNTFIYSSVQASYDAIIVPGGAKGAETLSSNTNVQKLVKSYYDSKKVVGMICAGK
jgi:protein DJ-1